MHKKFLMLALAAAAVSILSVPAGASAATVGHCEFSGLAGNISPGVMLQGGGGRYDFSTPPGSTGTNCTSSADPGAPAPSSIVSNGSFTNIVCGTGTARSQAADSTTIDHRNNGSSAGDIKDATYTIEFTAATGRLDIHTVTDNNSVTTADQLPVNGHVTIVPAQGGCTEPTGVTAFQVAGQFSAVY